MNAAAAGPFLSSSASSVLDQVRQPLKAPSPAGALCSLRPKKLGDERADLLRVFRSPKSSLK